MEGEPVTAGHGEGCSLHFSHVKIWLFVWIYPRFFHFLIYDLYNETIQNIVLIPPLFNITHFIMSLCVFSFFKFLFSSTTQPANSLLSLSVRNQDWLVFKQHRDLRDSCLVSCWIQQETRVSIHHPSQNFGNLPFWAAAALTLALIPHTDPDISQVLFITGIGCRLPFLFSHSCLSLSFPESPYWVMQKTSPSTSRISSGSPSLSSPSK